MEDVLKSLCGGDDKLHEAMSNFLLLDPKQQEEKIASFSKLLEEGTKALESGDKLRARVDFEIAARLGLYHQDRLSVEKVLRLAEQASEADEARRRLHETLLLNIDRALAIADQYYKYKYVDHAEAKKEEEERRESYLLEPTPFLVRS